MKDKLMSERHGKLALSVRMAHRLVFCFVTLLLGASLSSAQTAPSPAGRTGAKQPAANQQPAASKTGTEGSRTGSIRGRVLGEDGRPFANAAVLAFVMSAGGTSSGDTTDADGRFELKNLRPAAYNVQVFAQGYVVLPQAGAEFGALRYYRVGETANITMVKGGVITGTVMDADGKPLVAASVRAVRVRKATERSANLFNFTMPRMTDDRGVYRLYGLEPGVYVIATGGNGPTYGVLNAYDGDAPTYYPSATRDTAAELTVHAGEELTGIDVRYRGERGHSVSGFVTGTGGEANANLVGIAVTLAQASSGTMETSTFVTGQSSDRAFALSGVADGDYILMGVRGIPGTIEVSMASRRVSVRGTDVTGLELKLEPQGALSGNVVLDAPPKVECKNQRASSLEEIVITARREGKEKDEDNALPLFFRRIPAVPNERGEFRLANLHDGSHRLDVQLPGEDWYLRSIALPVAAANAKAAATTSKTAVPGAFNLKQGERLSGATLTIGQGAAALRGRVAMTAEGARLPPGLRVHLVPVEPERATDALRYAEATVEADGQFSLERLAPGRYWILARVAATAESENEERREVAWTVAERDKLRREAEGAGVKIELQPCQRLADYVLNYGPTSPK